MNKLAIFVEGYTEVVFVMKLIEEIAGANCVRIEHRRIRGGGKSGARRTFRLVRATKPETGQNYFVMIVDCGGDQSVKARILEEHENLTNNGFSQIIGLRAVRPDFTFADVPRLEAGLRTYIQSSLIPVTFILAIMEIEAWFLAEVGHFTKIDPAITVAAILANLHFDPANDDMESRPTPAGDLNTCYALGGKIYQKGAAQTTIDALDFATMYLWPEIKFRHFKRLCTGIDAFLNQ